MPVRIVTDSVASLPPEDVAAYDIDVVSLWVNDGESNVADVDIDLPSFYERLANTTTLPTSSQPSIEALADAFTRAAQSGDDAVGVFISEKMSGTLQTARLAARVVTEQYPGARIELFDSGSNSMQEGFAVLAAARAAAEGASVDECAAAAASTTRRTRYLFSPASLEYLRRGGRIGAASALLGQLLQIKPVLTVENGVTDTVAKVRTTPRALAEMGRLFAEDVAARGLVRAIVHHIGDPAPAAAFAREYVEPVAGVPVRVVPVSAVIGVHVGPAVGLVYEMEREAGA